MDPTLFFRPDWEVPTRYAVDYVLSRDDVDPKRLALSGHSMGGYFAPRAAAFEKRITALVANSLLPDLKVMFTDIHGFSPIAPSPARLEGAVDLTAPFNVYAGVVRERLGLADKPREACVDQMARYSLAGLEGKITVSHPATAS